MTWQPEIDELRAREKLAEQMGGADKVAQQHGRGKLDSRARIAGLIDAGSFREIGKIAGTGTYDADGTLLNLAASNLIFGRANIEGARWSPAPTISPCAAVRRMRRLRANSPSASRWLTPSKSR